jgi:hypothetical protein
MYLRAEGGINKMQIMEFLTKMVFFGLLIFNSIFGIFLFLNFMNNAGNPSKKLSETLIFLIAGCISIAGVYMAYKMGYATGSYGTGSAILFGTFITAVMCVMIGLLCFNGPINWQ